MPRETLDEGIKALQEDLLKMAGLVDEAIGLAVKSLVERDEALARRVIACDEEVNKAQREIDERWKSVV